MIALIIMFDWLPNLKFFLDVATITRPALITMFGNWLVAKKKLQRWCYSVKCPLHFFIGLAAKKNCSVNFKGMPGIKERRA